MTYPVEFSQVRLEYTDGGRSNKFYVLTLLSNSDGKTVLLRRFGKNAVGAFGELVAQNFPSAAHGEKAFEKLFREKTGKGYSVIKNDNATAKDESELRLKVGPAVWPKLPPSVVTHLDLGLDVSGRKELEQPRFDENGKFLGDQKPRTFTREEIEAQRALEAQQAAEETKRAYASNSLFGRF